MSNWIRGTGLVYADDHHQLLIVFDYDFAYRYNVLGVEPVMIDKPIASYNDDYEPVTLTGLIVDEPDLRDDYINLRFRVETLQRNDVNQPVDGLLREEAIGDPQGPSRPTEEEACINILFASLRDSLSVEENQILTLRLMDIPSQRVGEILGQGASEIAKMRKRIATTAWMVWSPPITEQEHSQDEKRAYSQTPPIPHELPANLVAVLTDQERQALTAYQQGASQEVAAQQSGLSQPTVSRLLAFVWESCQQPPGRIPPRSST